MANRITVHAACRTAAAALLVCWSIAALPASAADEPQFETDILPLLTARCVRCHGDELRKSDLSLTSAAGLLRGGESGAAIVAGNPEKSPLFEMVRDGHMPPKPAEPLAAAEIDSIRRWIELGAKSAEGEAKSQQVTDHQALPILLLRCSTCHGASRQEAGLDIRTRDAILRGGKSGPAIVAGKPDESLLIRRIHAGEMPPKKSLLDAGVKPVTSREVEILSQWIAAGAPAGPAIIDESGTERDPLVRPEDREFWSFQPPRAATVPQLPDGSAAANTIDAFLLEKLTAAGLYFSPETDRQTLIRRATFDLTGLPPTPEEVSEFVADAAPDAYERLIDRLLASPRYGERWARIWLDAAGYADSEGGKLDADHARPHAWRYRDYVIRSLNADKPYDRFLHEQIAGDELADYEHGPITPEVYDNLVATAFLRMAPDSTSEREVAFTVDRFDTIADELDVLGSAVLGLTVRCARCHSHKYDPIPQRDYYRLAAVFKGAYDEHDWLKPRSGSERQYKFPLRVLPHVLPEERWQFEHDRDAIDGQIKTLKESLEQQAEPIRVRLQGERLASLPAVLHDDLRKMLAIATAERNEVQKYLAEKFEKFLKPGRDELGVADAAFKTAAEETDKKVKELEGRRPSEPFVQALWDRGSPSPSYVYVRGDVEQPGAWVTAGPPAVISSGPLEVTSPWPDARQTGRRLALAHWLTAPENPLTARVLVNRVWGRHFGVGLVKTPDNFGHTGARPTHPELLDWLAVEFQRQGWSLKWLHRELLTSAAYRQSSAVSAQHETLDPDNVLLSRMRLTRLDAEAVRDAMLAVSGQLDETRYGPADPVTVRDDGLVTVQARPGGGWRRSIYAKQRRKEVPTFLETFDLPQMSPNCLGRPESIVAPQALHLLNNAEVRDLATALASRVLSDAGTDPVARISRVYALAYGRQPSGEELSLSQESIAALTAAWAAEATTASGPTPTPAERAWADYCHTLLNTAGFLYVD